MAMNKVTETDNWYRLVIPLDRHGGDALSDILHDAKHGGLPRDPKNFYQELKTFHEKNLKKLKKEKKLYTDQWDLLFPFDQLTRIDKFDITLKTILIKNCTKLFSNKDPKSQWVEEIRKLRNELMHYSDFKSMGEVEFSKLWNLLDVILKGLGYNVDMTSLKTAILDQSTVLYVQTRMSKFQAGEIHLENLIIINTAAIKDVRNKLDEHNTRLNTHDTRLNSLEKGVLDVKTKLEVLEGKRESSYDHTTEVGIVKMEKDTNDGACVGKYWNIYDNVSNFTGREDILSQMREKLLESNESNTYAGVVLSGLGGVGKTEIAAKYATLHKHDYSNIFWIDCENTMSALKELTAYLKLDTQNLEIKGIITLLFDFLKEKQSLFIFDNISSFKDLLLFTTTSKISTVKHHFILTTLNQDWDENKVGLIRVTVFSEEEAHELLCADSVSNEHSSITELIKKLEYYPLALQQARGYMKKHSISAEIYLQHFNNSREEILSINLQRLGFSNYGKTLLTVWQVAMEEISKNETAREILFLMGYMNGKRIKLKTFLHHPQIEQDELKLNTVIGIIASYSLVQINGKNIVIHKLVQKIIRFVERENAELWKEKLMEMLTDIALKDTSFCDLYDVWYFHVKTLILKHSANPGNELWCMLLSTTINQNDLNFGMNLFHLDKFHLDKFIEKDLLFNCLLCGLSGNGNSLIDNRASEHFESILKKSENVSENKYACFYYNLFAFLYFCKSERGEKKKAIKTFHLIKNMDYFSWRMDADAKVLLSNLFITAVIHNLHRHDMKSFHVSFEELLNQNEKCLNLIKLNFESTDTGLIITSYVINTKLKCVAGYDYSEELRFLRQMLDNEKYPIFHPDSIDYIFLKSYYHENKNQLDEACQTLNRFKLEATNFNQANNRIQSVMDFYLVDLILSRLLMKCGNLEESQKILSYYNTNLSDTYTHNSKRLLHELQGVNNIVSSKFEEAILNFEMALKLTQPGFKNHLETLLIYLYAFKILNYNGRDTEAEWVKQEILSRNQISLDCSPYLSMLNY